MKLFFSVSKKFQTLFSFFLYTPVLSGRKFQLSSTLGRLKFPVLNNPVLREKKKLKAKFEVGFKKQLMLHFLKKTYIRHRGFVKRKARAFHFHTTKKKWVLNGVSLYRKTQRFITVLSP